MLILSRRLNQRIEITNNLFPNDPPIIIEILDVPKRGGTRIKVGIEADKNIYSVVRAELNQQPNLLEEKQDASDREETI